MIDNNVTGTATIEWPASDVVAGNIEITITYDDGTSLVINAINMNSCFSSPPAFSLTPPIKGVVDDANILLIENITVNVNIINNGLTLYLTGGAGQPHGYLSGQLNNVMNNYYGVGSGAVSQSG